MNTPLKLGLALAAFSLAALPSRADEIRLKDGKKLNGVIVAYEDNMFKIKTDYGYILVEKDKIASIVPTGANAKPEKEAAKKEPAKKESEAEKTPATKSESPDASDAASDPAANLKPAAEKSAVKPATKASATAPEKRPAVKSTATNTAPNPDASTSAQPAPASSKPAATVAAQPAPAPPKEPEPPANREEVQGNTYTNFTHHFKMYKAPSWDLLEDARRALPNAVVAMGSHDESTLLVVGEDKASVPLETEAANIERRLREIYINYRRLSEEKTTVAGQPAIRFKYRGMADEHDWSGTLVVVSRGTSTITVLGMTYADTDLIQIQENVIARAISSLDFSVQ